MKRLVLILFLLTIASAAKIDVSIDDNLKCEISSLTYNTSNNVTHFLIEVYNTGSVGYRTQPRIDIFDGNESIFTGWGHEIEIMPGQRKASTIHWYNKPGNYTLRTRVYFGNEILEHKEAIFVKKPAEPENVFSIQDFRAYDNFVIFDISTTKAVNNITIIPDSYLSSWVFEQASFEALCQNCRRSFLINYTAPAWMPSSVKVMVLADEGRYYSEETFKIEKNQGFLWIFYFLIDNFKLFLMYR